MEKKKNTIKLEAKDSEELVFVKPVAKELEEALQKCA